jgi:hypothetical protein
MRRIRIMGLCALTLSLCLPQLSLAWSEGIGISVPVIAKDPDGLHGLNASIWYDPETLVWRQFHLFFEALAAHYWIDTRKPYHETNIIAVSPVLRYNFHQHLGVIPYFELSVGASYISNTHFGNRNLGMHFAFQDRAGAGLLLGSKQQFTLGAHIVHYSNACLSSHNSGITIPLLIDFTYKFS